MNAGIDKPFEVIVETCPHCGSNKISWDGAIRWSIQAQRYRHVDVHDCATCQDCGESELKVVKTVLAHIHIEPAQHEGGFVAIITHCADGKLETRAPWPTFSKALRHAQQYVIKKWVQV